MIAIDPRDVLAAGGLPTTPAPAPDVAARIEMQLRARTVAAPRSLESGAALSPPHGVSFVASGAFRVFFHRLNPDGMPWCVAPDAGGWEVACRDVVIAAPCRTVFRPKATPDDEDGRPSAWIAAEGRLEMAVDGLARIVPLDWRDQPSAG